MTVADFSRDVRNTLAAHLAPGQVAFRGSIANGTFDEWSDVDLEVRVHQPLDATFFSGLEQLLTHAYGQALIRYDPDYRSTTTEQDVRFSFYAFPVFWRVDLLLRSNIPAPRKYPDPFPDWSVGSSAFMNLIWAMKNERRGKEDDADRYVAAACRKLELKPLRFTAASARFILSELARREDVDAVLLSKARDAMPHMSA